MCSWIASSGERQYPRVMTLDDRHITARVGLDVADVAGLNEAINVAAGHRNALDGQMVDIAIWMLSHDDWKGEGLTTPERFLAFRCGLSASAARRYVAVAERADELPESVDALRRGELALDQLMPIVRRVPDWADGQVLSLAKRLTVGQITAMIGKYDFARSGPPGHSPVGDDTEVGRPADDAHGETTPHPVHDDGDLVETSAPADVADEVANRPVVATVPTDRCWYGVGDDGRWRLHLETSAECGMIIESAIRDRRDLAFRDGRTTISDAEALADACGRSLEAIDDPARRERFRTNIHLHTDGRATDRVGQALPDVISDHITCDGLLTPVFHENGVPISVGRTQRIVPERTRKQVLLRDGACRVPGCGATHHLDIHHIIHWSDHGPTDTWNLVALCGHHHRMHHHGRLGIVGDADVDDGLRITNARGVEIADTGARPDPPAGSPPTPESGYRPPLGERLDMNWVSFVHPRRLAYIAEQAERSRQAPHRSA